MRVFTLVALVVGFAGMACAGDLGNRIPPKPFATAPANVPRAERQAGDTIASATVIPALPYFDSGTTIGYTNDYDAVCPYTGSSSPDVCYRYTASSIMSISIDLCGSDYDTKVYVYDSEMNLIACNDDYYTDQYCGIYVSRLDNVILSPGETYAIIVDGYGGDAGNYVFQIPIICGPCIVPCPAGNVAEGEPPLVDGYVDLHNGGCNTPPDYPLQAITGDLNGERIFCGVGGWYDFGGADYRDTDWFVLTMGEGGVIDVTIDAEQSVIAFELGPQDCDAVGVLQSVTAGPCMDAYLTITGYQPEQVVWLWVGSTVFTAPAGAEPMFDYVIWLSGLSPGGVMTERTLWGSLKALY